MPDYFSHSICAEIIYEKLDFKYKNAINSKTLYLLGAQGGDVFFAYNIKPTAKNLGRILHNVNSAELFEKLICGNLSYAAGFATHYALDCTLHPDVYAYESTKRSPFTHSKFENDLGFFISRKYGICRRIIPREQLLACTSPVYDSVKRVEPLITMTGVERCLKRYFTYTSFIYRTKRQRYKCDYDFTGLDKNVESAVELGYKAVQCVLENDIDEQIFDKQFLNK